MKKFISVILSLLTVICFSGCRDNASENNNDNQSGQNAKAGEIAVFYYTFSDTYISSVRAEMDKELKNAGFKFQNYDGNGNQTTQTEQVQTAVAKGCSLLAVNIVDTGSDDAAQNIVNLAKEKNIPVVFFNRSVNESVIKSYDKCVMVGTDYEMVGHMQGQMIGDYLVKHYNSVDLNRDGKISYVLFKGQEGNLEAIARTQFAVEDANKVLSENGKPALEFYDEVNQNKYLVDQDGTWSSAAATDYMGTILAQYSESAGNMIELVIANNDEMALGAIASLQAAGYNNGLGKKIPVFGVDATQAAKAKIEEGAMTGTIKQDAEGMADAIVDVAENYLENKTAFEGIDEKNVVGNWRINIPYEQYVR